MLELTPKQEIVLIEALEYFQSQVKRGSVISVHNAVGGAISVNDGEVRDVLSKMLKAIR